MLSAAALAFAAFVMLGYAVSAHPPAAIDVAELGQFGVATDAARFLTGAGRFPTYVAMCVAALVFGLVRRAWLVRMLVAVVGLVVVWQTSDFAKLAFHRMRPPHPILAETSFGYPSGHADLAIFFYGLWMVYLWETDLPKRIRVALVTLMTLWIAAIGWSRLALGAHYPSDVLGGYLFGAGWLGLGQAVAVLRQRR